MRGPAASTLDSAPILTKADAKAAADSSLAWAKIAQPTKGHVKSPSPKAVVASPVEPAPSLRFQTAPMAVENSEASTALALGSIVWPVRAASALMPAPRPMKCNATQPVAASKTLVRPARPWTAHQQPGACCIDGTCAQLEQTVCLSVSGTFGGAGVDCGSVVCEQPCPEDLDNNGSVDFNDILSLLAAWGPCGTCDEDIDENGTVDFADLLVMLAAYGDC